MKKEALLLMQKLIIGGESEKEKKDPKMIESRVDLDPVVLRRRGRTRKLGAIHERDSRV